MKVNTKEIFDSEVRNTFIQAYKGWTEICKPQRIKNGGCSECPLDGYHWAGVCGSFQDIGRAFEKRIASKVRKLKTEKSIREREISEFTEFLTDHACPGPDLYHSSTGSANK